MPNDPYHPSNRLAGRTDRHMMVTNKFAVMIQNIALGYFRKASGLDVSVAIDEVKEGGENRFTHYLPGRAAVSKVITLERGVVYNDLLWRWFQEMVEDGTPVARTIHIQAHENIHSEANAASKGRRFSQSLVTWSLEDALPIKWSGLSFDTEQDHRLVQTLTFVCKRIVRGLGESDVPLGDTPGSA